MYNRSKLLKLHKKKTKLSSWRTSGRLLFEFPPSGGVLSSAELVTTTYGHFELTVDNLGLVIPEFILLCFILYFSADFLMAVRTSLNIHEVLFNYQCDLMITHILT